MLAVLILFWSAWRASPFKAAANGEEIGSGIDVIAIQLDILSLIIAVVAVGLGFAGFVGYQAIKDGALQKAQDCAEEEVKRISPPIIRREVEEFLRAFPREMPISERDLAAIVAAVGDEEKEGGNGG